MRPISSTRSSGMEISLVARQLGTVNSSLRVCGCSTPNASALKMLTTSSVESLRAGRNLLQQLHSARQGADCVLRVLAFLKAHGSVSTQFEPRGRFAHICR